MNKNIGWVFAVTVLVLAGCAHQKLVSKSGDLERTIAEQNIGTDYLEGMGIGAADPSLPSQTQRMATSREAAIVSAQNELLGFIKGEEIKGGVTVRQAVETNSKIQSQIDAVIKGAEIVRTQWTSDDGCVVVIRVSKKRLQRMMGVQFQ